MDSLNTFRAILVGAAVIALLAALALGEVLAAAVLAVGVAVHGGLSWYLHRMRRADADALEREIREPSPSA